MAEGIVLPELPISRAPGEILLSAADRVERLEAARPQILAACEGETDSVALQATLACLLFQALAQTNFCGFYRRVGPHTLAVGPYHGSMGCLRIEFDRGVCGKCARTREVQRIPDVRAIADHISCDDRSISELVVPIVAGGELRAVLDLDSPHVDAFSEEEAAVLVSLMTDIFDRDAITY